MEGEIFLSIDEKIFESGHHANKFAVSFQKSFIFYCFVL